MITKIAKMDIEERAFGGSPLVRARSVKLINGQEETVNDTVTDLAEKNKQNSSDIRTLTLTTVLYTAIVLNNTWRIYMLFRALAGSKPPCQNEVKSVLPQK